MPCTFSSPVTQGSQVQAPACPNNIKNEKDDEMDLEVNTVCHRNGPVPPLGSPTD